MTNEHLFGIINTLGGEYMSSENLKCCFTGYRPQKLPFKSVESNEYKEFENSVIAQLLAVCNEGCRTFYTGMAMGFDILAAELVLLKKNAYDIPLKLVCVIPFIGQENTFSDIWKQRYNRVLNACDEKIILSDKYYSGCYQNRNIYMVDNCDYVLTWFDGKPGGTMNTINYALKKQRYVFNAFRGETEGFAVQTQIKII